MDERLAAPRPRGGLGPGGVGGMLLVVAFVCATAALPALVLEGLSIATSCGAAVLCLLASRRSSGSGRRGWALLAALLLLWAGADVLWALADLGVIHDDISLADVVYVAGVPAAVGGLMLLPSGGWERGASTRVLLDVGVLTVPLLVAGELLVVRRLGAQQLSMADVYLIAWPVVDVLLASMAFVITRRREERMRPDLALVTLAFTAWAVGDTWLASQTLAGGEYFGSLVQLPFLVAPLLLGLAALTACRPARRPGAGRDGGVRRHATCRIVVVLPDLVVLASGVTCIAVGIEHTYEWVMVAVGCGLAVLRYGVVAVDTQHLRETLERRVDERTASLSVLTGRLETIVGTVDEGILGLRADGVVAFVNPAAARVLGVAPDDLLGERVCERVCGVAHDSCPLCLAAQFGERLERVETRFTRGDGHLVPVEVGATPVVREQTDDSLACVVTFRDVTASRAVEQAKHQFVSTVSHELRTPLSAINGALEMLADGDGGDLPDEAAALVASAERGAVRLRRLVDDILDTEAVASGRFSMTARPLPVAPVVCGVVETLSAWADGFGVRLEARDLDGVALADPGRLEQALTNVAGNAVKFSSPGSSVWLSARVRPHDVLVEVRDEGRGIPAADLPHVFDRFHQAAESDASEKGGAGLGLTITRSIIERHGGEIWVDSELGHGTTVSFTLPRPVDAAASRPDEGSGSETPAPVRA